MLAAGALAAWVALLAEGPTRDGAAVTGGLALLILAVGLLLRLPAVMPAAIVLLAR